MPFVKVSRDKRGYELISLMHASARRGKLLKPRLLYAFRTPPGVKIGREPFDESVRRELETRNPDVQFDWVKLANIPVPSPDVEYWRERRRAEKAAKQARREAEAEDSADGGEEPALAAAAEPEESIEADILFPVSAAGEATILSVDVVEVDIAETDQAADEFEGGEPAAADESGPAAILTPGEEPAGGDGRPTAKRRRRRRGGRKRHKRPADGLAMDSAEPPASQAAAALPEPAADGDPDPSKVPEDTSKEA